MHILLVEDDAAVAKFTARILSEDGYTVTIADNGDDAHRIGVAGGYDLALVDLELPRRSGFSVVRGIRDAGRNVPIIILSGRNEDADIVLGLDAGADDYLVKPVQNAVLKARVRAALRRGGAGRSDVLTAGKMQLDRRTRRVTCGGAVVDLTTKDYALLEYFMLRRGEVVSRSDLLSGVWGMDFDPESNMIDAAMNRLRSKLDAGRCGAEITTVRGVGFTLK